MSVGILWDGIISRFVISSSSQVKRKSRNIIRNSLKRADKRYASGVVFNHTSLYKRLWDMNDLFYCPRLGRDTQAYARLVCLVVSLGERI